MTASGYQMYSKASRNSQYELIERYAPLVKRIAYHLLARLPASVQVEDLIQAGMIGLLEVSTKYDSTKGASFETYAGIRIRGAMLDEVRKGDWAPRSVHRNTRMVSDAIRAIEAKTGRDAKDHEVAAELQLSLDDYWLRTTSLNDLRAILARNDVAHHEIRGHEIPDRVLVAPHAAGNVILDFVQSV